MHLSQLKYCISLSSIILLSLSIMPSHASEQALSLLVHQCLNQKIIELDPVSYSSSNLDKITFEDELALAANNFERKTLGLQNIYSLLQYYQAKNIKYSSARQEGILRCQLRLADRFQQLIHDPYFVKLITKLKNANTTQLTNLGLHLSRLSNQSLDLNEKSQLHVAEASILSRLNSKAIHLDILGSQCQLTQPSINEQSENMSSDTSPSPSPFNIIRYLKQQSNPLCREKVWQAYQVRAKNLNQLEMQRFNNIHQKQAIKAGFKNYADYQLRNNYLNTPEKVKRFLDSQTHQLNYSPWDLAQVLHSAKIKAGKANKSTLIAQSISLNTPTLISLTQEPLTELGLILEAVSNQRLHLWHNDRFLGEIIIRSATRFQSIGVKRSIIGHQFGQSELSLKPELKNKKDIILLANALAQSIAHLAASQHFHFNVSLALEPDMMHLGKKWLAQHLAQQLFKLETLTEYRLATNSIQSQIIANYRQQRTVFRAKVALSHAQNIELKNEQQIETEFKQSFTGNWTNAADYQYGFKGVIRQGPNYYHSLWQDKLAQLILAQATQSPKAVFSNLVINEHAFAPSAILAMILKPDLTQESILTAIQQLK